MSDASSPRNASFERLIGELVTDLRPVARLRPPWLQALAWVAVVVVVAAGLATQADLNGIARRLGAAPDMWLTVIGSALTAILSAVATFQLALPDRRAAWALLPLPSLGVWIGASGLGCTRTWLVPGTQAASLAETGDCLRFIVGLSVPLSLVLFLMLRRSYSMHPSLTGATAGLSAAAAAATLLAFFHPFDATVTDLAVHAAAVLLVVGLNRLLGGKLLFRRMRRPGRDASAAA